jgi:hypothetical protein
MVQSLLKTAEGTTRYDHIIGGLSITPRHPPIPAPSRVEVLRATHHMHYLETTFIKQG